MQQKSAPQRSLVATALRSTRGAFGGVMLLSGVTNLLMLTGPLFMMQVYDRVLTSHSIPTLVALSVLAAALYLVMGVIDAIRARVLVRIGAHLDEQLGGLTFSAVLLLPVRTPSGDAAQPMRDLDRIRSFFSGSGPIAICDLPWLPLYMGIVFSFHASLGWLATATSFFLVGLTLLQELVTRGSSEEVAREGARRMVLLDAGRRNAEALYAMGMAGSYRRVWDRVNGAYLALQDRLSDVAGTFSCSTKTIRMALQSAMLAAGAALVIAQAITPGTMIAVSIITSRALAPVEQAIAQWRGFMGARQSRTRLEKLLDLLETPHEPMALPRPSRNVRAEVLTVAVPGTKDVILRDVSFEVEAGDGLGVIGPSGSGKSTLARALVGVWPAVQGHLRLDGADITQWTPASLGPHIGYLPQDVELFDGTVSQNIARLEASPDPGRVIAAAKRAGAHDMILTLPQGYDTRLGPNGSALSGGQRQRVGLARALYGEPFLVVLDEPNASLDAEGEAALTQAILDIRQAGAVVVVIAHRPSALVALNKVLAMSRGRVAAFGPRDEVLRKTVRSVAATS